MGVVLIILGFNICCNAHNLATAHFLAKGRKCKRKCNGQIRPMITRLYIYFSFWHIFLSEQAKRFLSCRLVTDIVDIGSPADWVKISVRETVSVCLSYFSLNSLLKKLLEIMQFPVVLCWDPESLLWCGCTEGLLWSICSGSWASAGGGKHFPWK